MPTALAFACLSIQIKSYSWGQNFTYTRQHRVKIIQLPFKLFNPYCKWHFVLSVEEPLVILVLSKIVLSKIVKQGLTSTSTIRGVAPVPQSGRRPTLLPLAERKLVSMIRDNPKTIKTQACHKLEAAGTLQSREIYLAVDWEAATRKKERSPCFKTDTSKQD